MCPMRDLRLRGMKNECRRFRGSRPGRALDPEAMAALSSSGALQAQAVVIVVVTSDMTGRESW